MEPKLYNTIKPFIRKHTLVKPYSSMYNMLINHLYDLQYLYMINIKFITFSYLKAMNHRYEIRIGKSWYQKPYIWLIKHVLDHNENLTYYHTWKPFIATKLYIHTHVFINDAYIKHTNKSHVCWTIPYSCSKHNRI